MALELVAKQVKINNFSSAEMYEKLHDNGIFANSEKIKNFKDGTLRNKSAYAHIEILFNIFGLDFFEKKVLKCLSLIGSTNMTEEFFNELCESTTEEKTALRAHLKTPSKQEHKRHGTKKAIFIPKRSKYRLK